MRTLFVLLLTAASLFAQTKPLRLYVFDCGRLKSGNPQVLLDRGVKVTDMSVEAFLIVHPRGTLLWDSGVIPDELVRPEGTVEARATVHTTLKDQLAAIGYKPSGITYLALSHNHYDHSANGNNFATATWLVQRPEREFMFPELTARPGVVSGQGKETPPATPINGAARWSKLKDSQTKILDGDYDVFGDGSVMIISTPGHTPGHQSLLVNLKKTGPILLSGDLYHYPAERTLKNFTPFANLGDPAQEAASKAKVEALLKQKHAKLWIQHDILADAKLRKSPGYYE
ncbi:MAG TPA: N-acyl homoserine lactonase family protein [Bryobacteraceae bacterium]|nr:N-acyl homoserine lactonase family protein [Bryobacteraceae bacterium]